MAEISQITLPSGTTYDIKDTTARSMAGGAIRLIEGTCTTPLVDEATTNPIIIDGESYTAVSQEAVFYGKKEFVYDGTKWHEFGDMSGLGDLALKDSASGSFTPSGSNADSAVTGSCTVTPSGSVSAPSVSITPTTDDVYSITAVGTLPSCTLPSLTCSVSSENLTLSWSAGSFSAGSLPTKGSKQTVMTGASAEADAPTFTGSSSTGTISGTAAAQTFSGTAGAVTVS